MLSHYIKQHIRTRSSNVRNVHMEEKIYKDTLRNFTSWLNAFLQFQAHMVSKYSEHHPI